jgi:intracellular multiplication protein IcmT
MWRDTGLPVRIFMVDGRACFPVLLAVVWWSWTTLWIALAGVVFFGTISFFGLTVPAVIRLGRRFLAGPVRPALDPLGRRGFG